MKSITVLCAAILLLAPTAGAAAGTLYVAPGGSDAASGADLATAKATLQAAIDSLGAEGGTVYVADGEYAFTSESDTAVTITTPVKVIGLSRDASKVTITRTGTPARNFVLNHADCSLEFVTVAGGTLRSDKGVSVSLRQGLLADCVICDADGRDWQCHGAVFADGTSHIVRCVFRGNKGQYDGSALQARGSAVIENCLFTDNESVGGVEHGGGTVNLGDSVRFVNCTVTGNRGLKSTGVYTSEWGGGRPAVVNCAIYGNTADSDETGHGHVWYGWVASFSRCGSDPSEEGEAINGDCFVGEAGFRNPLAGDYTLSPASALIDRGAAYDQTGATSETDLAGNPRRRRGGTAELDGTVDVGCYEYLWKGDAVMGRDVGLVASALETVTSEPVTFTATVFGTDVPQYYYWRFGDSDSVFETERPTVSHSYATPGQRTVQVTVRFVSNADETGLLPVPVEVSPKVIYVATTGGAVYPYADLATATRDLQTALGAAGPRSQVLVADGTYRPSDATGFVIDKPVTVRSVSGDPAKCVLQESTSSGDRRVVTVNHAKAVLAGFTLDGGERTGNDGDGATLRFGDLGGTVTDCVIRGGRASNWGGDAALALVTAAGRVTHSIFEAGLALDDYNVKNSRPKTSNIKVCGQVDNCLIRNFNRDADNQNILLVNNGGRLLNCTVVDGLCGLADDAERTPCYGVRAESGARVENCAIVGVRDSDGGVRAWAGDASAFVNCATDTAEAINGTCLTVTKSAFRDYAHGDFRIVYGSPLWNSGLANELASGTDLQGARRKQGAQDIGCYEFNRAGTFISLR